MPSIGDNSPLEEFCFFIWPVFLNVAFPVLNQLAYLQVDLVGLLVQNNVNLTNSLVFLYFFNVLTGNILWRRWDLIGWAWEILRIFLYKDNLSFTFQEKIKIEKERKRILEIRSSFLKILNIILEIESLNSKFAVTYSFGYRLTFSWVLYWKYSLLNYNVIRYHHFQN